MSRRGDTYVLSGIVSAGDGRCGEKESQYAIYTSINPLYRDWINTEIDGKNENEAWNHNESKEWGIC